jgi:hypothetical protein
MHGAQGELAAGARRPECVYSNTSRIE